MSVGFLLMVVVLILLTSCAERKLTYYPDGTLKYKSIKYKGGKIKFRGGKTKQISYYENGNRKRVFKRKCDKRGYNCYYNVTEKEYYESGKLKKKTHHTVRKIKTKEYYEDGSKKSLFVWEKGDDFAPGYTVKSISWDEEGKKKVIK